MISNPVVVKQGGGQVYTITDNTTKGVGVPNSAEAGQRVTFIGPEALGSVTSITDSEGRAIPWGTDATLPDASLTRAPSIGYCYFIMPASDVTIS